MQKNSFLKKSEKSKIFVPELKSRVKILQGFVSATLLMVIVYFCLWNVDVHYFYACFSVLGFAAGYWAVLMTMSSEQFGTNIRATVTTSVPNFIRASLVPITLLYAFFQYLGMMKWQSALLVGVLCCVIALWATRTLHETYHKDLDYFEE